MKLTAKQRLFADEYIKSGNATQSAIKAGYSPKTVRSIGQENLTKPDIKAYIDAKMAEIESHKIADAKEAMQAITAIARGETTETQAQINPLSGKWEKIEVPADLKVRLSAWKEILKRYPLADEFSKAQLRKMIADARVAEARAKVLEDNGADVEEALDRLLTRLDKEEDKNEHGRPADS
ncbi:terminase small subunit [Limosilactobacillus reuteri]|uniref:terminase small subunit n=1 Tax=Limosilactobacillus reuteri TaxID=1598 RepID=UPI001E39AFF0|nr:terminase small subunit [Limosilactobacillus reuteri]MCC4405886.1 terminase small subunit [Limosilactobacillus reuteri]